MKTEFVPDRASKQPRCEVCDVKVLTIEAIKKTERGYVICPSLQCQRIMEQKNSVNLEFFKRQVENRKRVVQNRIESEAIEHQRVASLQSNEEVENNRVRQILAKQKPDLPEHTHLLNLPSGHSRLIPLTDDRLSKYRAHLWKNIVEASELSSASELTDYLELKERKKCLETERRLENNSAVRSVSEKLCGICKGGCCVLGKDHAFNTVSTMRRYMDANPSLTNEEVLAAYMEKVETETVEKACINQTRNGCGLPREMRSDTCNGFFCSEIKSYHRLDSDPDRNVKQLIAVQRAHNLWDRWAADANHEVVGVQLVDAREAISVDLTEE